MSWTPIEPKTKVRERADFTLAIGGPKADRYVIMMKVGVAPKGWKAGTKVAVSLGGGEHHGQLLIAADGICPFELKSVPRNTEIVALRVPLPAGVTQAKRPGVAVKFTVRQNKEVLVVLPAFAQPPAATGSVMTDTYKPKR